MHIKTKLPLPVLGLLAVIAIVGLALSATPQPVTPVESAAPVGVVADQWGATDIRVVENLEPTILAFVTNKADTTRSQSFILTVSDGSGLVATATAAVSDVDPGEGVTLTFIPQEVHGVLANVDYTYHLETKYK